MSNPQERTKELSKKLRNRGEVESYFNATRSHLQTSNDILEGMKSMQPESTPLADTLIEQNNAVLVFCNIAEVAMLKQIKTDEIVEKLISIVKSGRLEKLDELRSEFEDN